MQQVSSVHHRSTRTKTSRIEKITFLGSLDRFLKRFLDIFASFFGLIFLLPFFAVIGILIKKDSPGPVFFKGVRLGRYDHHFKILKFRTMYENPASYQGPKLTGSGDTRITPFGKWLRDTKINELPQLWNVLIGEMSLVGPRPEDVIIGNDWEENARKEILSVRPGITSPASILYHDEEKLLSKSNLLDDYFNNILPDKIRLDLLYVRNRSFGSDLDILFWTLLIWIPTIFKEKIPEGYLFSGPFTRLINRYASWFFVDTVSSFLIIEFAILLSRLQAPLNWGVQNLITLSFFLAIIFGATNSVLGLHRVEWSSASLNEAILLSVSSWFMTFLLLFINQFIQVVNWFNVEPLPISMILLVGLMAQVFFISTRFSWRIISSTASIWLNWRRHTLDLGERVLIVGAGNNFSAATWLLKQDEYRYIFRIMGVVDDDIPSKQGMLLNGCLVLGKINDIPRILESQKIGVIVFTTMNIPLVIKRYVEKLKAESSVRIILLDDPLKIISQQINFPLASTDFSSWSENYFKFLALHDSVTGLPNQVLFQDRLSHSIALAKRNRTTPMMMFVDLEFQDENTMVTQETWNEIVKRVTGRLLKIRRESDTLTFLGTHGFAFIFDNNPNDTAITRISERVISALKPPIEYQGQMFRLCTSIYLCNQIENEAVESSIREGTLLEYLAVHRRLFKSSDI